MKVLIGNKLLSLKNCQGYTRISNLYYLIYDRFEKISLVHVYGLTLKNDLEYYEIKYIYINRIIEKLNLSSDKICKCLDTYENNFNYCGHFYDYYFRFDYYL